MRLFAASLVIALIFVSSGMRLHATAQESTLLDLLPTAEEVGPGFLSVADRTRPLEEQATGFADAGEAARLLAGWAWQENAYQRFESAALSPAGYPLAAVEISLTRFASAQAAADAMAYFLQDRTAVLGQREAPAQTLIGDEARAVTGPVNGAADDTLYVRSGPLLLRVSVAAAEGAPAPSAEEIARGIIGRAGGASPPIVMMQPAGALPETLPLDDAACFGVAAEGELDNEQIATLLAAGAGALPAIAALGWQDGVYRQFACDPPPGRAGWVDVSVHRFRDAAAAADAVAAFAASRGRGLGLAQAPASALGDRARRPRRSRRQRHGVHPLSEPRPTPLRRHRRRAGRRSPRRRRGDRHSAAHAGHRCAGHDACRPYADALHPRRGATPHSHGCTGADGDVRATAPDVDPRRHPHRHADGNPPPPPSPPARRCPRPPRGRYRRRRRG